jgi:hypothetical protein
MNRLRNPPYGVRKIGEESAQEAGLVTGVPAE